MRSELETLRAFALSRQADFAEWLIDRPSEEPVTTYDDAEIGGLGSGPRYPTPTITCDCCHGTVNEDESDGGICNDCYPACSMNYCAVNGD